MDAFGIAAFTLVGTLAGVALSGLFALLSERRRLATETRREQRMEEREDAVRLAAARAEEQLRSEHLAGHLRNLFLVELRKFRSLQTDEPNEYAPRFERSFRLEGEIELRKLIAGVRDDAKRGMLTDIVEALGSAIELSYYLQRDFARLGESLLTTGAELAAAFERQQAPDDELTTKLQRVRSDLEFMEQYWEEQRIARSVAVNEAIEQRFESQEPQS